MLFRSDDDRWWTDGDLGFLLGRGAAIKKEQEAHVDAAKSRLTELDMAGAGQKEKNKVNDELDQAQKQLAKTAAILDPLLRARESAARSTRRR